MVKLFCTISLPFPSFVPSIESVVNEIDARLAPFNFFDVTVSGSIVEVMIASLNAGSFEEYNFVVATLIAMNANWSNQLLN